MAAKKVHPGFKAVQRKVAAKQGVSMERAGAIVAAGARKASKKAVAANPRLKRVSDVVEKKTKVVKAASKMTPREAAARKIASESLARRQSENTTGMWSNDNPRGQKIPKTPKYKDPTKTKGFAYGRKTQ